MQKLITLAIATLALIVALSTVASANLAPGVQSPNFSLTTLDGKTFVMSNYSSTQPRVLVMDICATWCGPCRNEIPYLVALSKKLDKNNAMVVGVFVDAQRDPVASFVRQQKIPYTVVLDPNGQTVSKPYSVQGIPATYIIDKKGTIRYVHSGFPGDAAGQQKEAALIEKEVNTLLAEK